MDEGGYVSTRLSLHRLACYVISPARAATNPNAVALRPTAGGIGTPPFGPDGIVLRIEGTDIVREAATGGARREPITTLSAAGRLAGIAPAVELQDRLDLPPPGDLDAALPVDGDASRLLCGWLGEGYAALEELRSAATADEDASPARIWPEHFDAAVELGAGDRRGTYGASPGDRHHPMPYLYATVWAGVPGDPFYNAAGFAGAWLTYEEAGDRGLRDAARAFFGEALERARRR